MPASPLLDNEGQGFAYLISKLPQERLSIAVAAQAGAQRAFDEAVRFTKQRVAFGQPVVGFLNTKFKLAGLKSQLQVGWTHFDWAIRHHIAGEQTMAEASAVKQWHSDMQGRIRDDALQQNGGAGYMNDYPIARLWRDALVSRIYGGNNEIMWKW